MITDRYYFNHLSDDEKPIYTLLYKGIVAHNKEIRLPGRIISKETVQKVFHAVTHDNPYFYYFNQTHMDFTISPFGSVLLPQYFCTVDQVADYNNRVQDYVNKLVTDLDLANCSELETIKRVHDYICKNIVYDHEALNTTKVNRIVAAHSIIGVFAKQRAVCEGIAKAMKLLLNTANVACIVVSGIASLNQGGEHAWNIVKIDGKAYHLDVTWDMSNSMPGLVNYDYFNLPDGAIVADHFDYGAVPQCSSWSANYFFMNRLLFDNIKQIEQYIVDCLNNGKQKFYFKVKNEGHKMSDIAVSIKQFVFIEASNRGIKARVITSYNEEQRTACIVLHPV